MNESINLNTSDGPPGTYSMDLGEGIDYEALSSEDSDENWLEDNVSEVREI